MRKSFNVAGLIDCAIVQSERFHESVLRVN